MKSFWDPLLAPVLHFRNQCVGISLWEDILVSPILNARLSRLLKWGYCAKIGFIHNIRMWYQNFRWSLLLKEISKQKIFEHDPYLEETGFTNLPSSCWGWKFFQLSNFTYIILNSGHHYVIKIVPAVYGLTWADREYFELSNSFCFMWIGPGITEILTINQVDNICNLMVTIQSCK